MAVETRGRPRDPELDRRILEATRATIRATGYESLSIEGVARAAGAGKQSVYRRWPRKPLLVFDAFFGGADAVAEALPDTGSFSEDLVAVTASQTRIYEVPELRDLVRGLIADCLSQPHSLDALRTRFLRPRLATLGRLVERARERGEVRRGIDAAVIAEVIAGTMLAHFLLFSEGQGDGFGEQLAALVARGAR